MRPALLLVFVFGVLGACKEDPNTDVCKHYARLLVDCLEDKSDDPGIVGDAAVNLCIKGMSGKHEEMFGAKYKAMIECTRTATTCAAYRTCQGE